MLLNGNVYYEVVFSAKYLSSRKASLTRKLLSLVLNGQRSVFFMSLQSAVWLRGVA